MRLARKKPPAPMVPIASMGDIAFLLIIFFMVVSNFMKEAHVELERPKSPDIEKMKPSQISVSYDKDSQLWLQGTICTVEELESGLSALLETNNDKLVMVKIDKNIPEEKFQPVMMALSKAGAKIALEGIEE
ncbi:MAG: biopolymer transporter ExbD [Planctomycetes bacterium]|nr:biopolymer transporter ExbD [Planctomycetota bacterium]